MNVIETRATPPRQAKVKKRVVALTRLVADYPLVAATLVAALVTLTLSVSPVPQVAIWFSTIFVLSIAGRSAASMVRSLRSGRVGIDVLAVTAIISTIALGDYWAALVVALMLTSGEALEDFAARRARNELSALIDRTPRAAHLVTQEATIDVAVEVVRVGDTVEVRPGETVPVDGVVEQAASFDESTITGESLPVWHEAGDEVLSGAVSGSDVVRLRATALARDSQYQTIVGLVEAASNEKAPFVRLADRVAAPFTAAAFLIAGTAWFLSGDPSRFAEVMVVATPCPLLIAAPVAFLAGVSRAASIGAIVKSGGTLEVLARVKTVAFDKTGTLTRGQPVVTRVEPAGGTSVETIVADAAAVEVNSVHVLAQAATAEANRLKVVVPQAGEVEEHVGLGVTGMVNGHSVSAGKLKFVDPGATWPGSGLTAGEMAVYVSRDGALAGRIVLSDAIRPETRTTIAQLDQLGISRAMMLTGDSTETAELIAMQAGITDVRASLLPADKVSEVSAERHRPVMMVGDGINDAPVLAAADVAVAMGARGATAASETADVVVLVEDLTKLAMVVSIAQTTVRIAYQSVWLGMGLSTFLMVVASTGAIPAIVGATLQEVVDALTIFNSLRAARTSRKGTAFERRS